MSALTETVLYVYWCPRCEVQTERPWHRCKRGPALIPQLDEETTCERIQVVPRSADGQRCINPGCGRSMADHKGPICP